MKLELKGDRLNSIEDIQNGRKHETESHSWKIVRKGYGGPEDTRSPLL